MRHINLFLDTLIMKYKTYFLFFTLSFLLSCSADNVLTKKEMQIQSKADAIVANMLFDNDLNDKASYNISKTGSVTIKFADSVKEKNYTKIVNLLRSNKSVDGVFAEQSGSEVCGLP